MPLQRPDWNEHQRDPGALPHDVRRTHQLVFNSSGQPLSLPRTRSPLPPMTSDLTGSRCGLVGGAGLEPATSCVWIRFDNIPSSTKVRRLLLMRVPLLPRFRQRQWKTTIFHPLDCRLAVRPKEHIAHNSMGIMAMPTTL